MLELVLRIHLCLSNQSFIDIQMSSCLHLSIKTSISKSFQDVCTFCCGTALGWFGFLSIVFLFLTLSRLEWIKGTWSEASFKKPAFLRIGMKGCEKAALEFSGPVTGPEVVKFLLHSFHAHYD